MKTKVLTSSGKTRTVSCVEEFQGSEWFVIRKEYRKGDDPEWKVAKGIMLPMDEAVLKSLSIQVRKARRSLGDK